MKISQSEINILLDALEAHGDAISPGLKGTDYTYEQLVDKKLLKKVMVQSGFNPKYGYKLTVEGRDVASYHDYRIKRDFYEKRDKS